MNAPAPKISEVITALLELQGIIGDQPITLAKFTEDEADVPLPGIAGLGVMIHSSNGEVRWDQTDG